MSVEYVPLRYVTSVLARGTAPNYVDDGPVRVVSQAANQDSGLDWERSRFHGFAGDPRKLKGYLEFGDSLVNSTGTGTLGRVGWFEKSPDDRPCVADGHVTVTRFDPTRVDKRFGFYYLKSNEFQEFMFETLVNGSTNQIELSRERMGAVSMPVPPLEEQRRIADFLDAETARIDKLNALRQRQLDVLEEKSTRRVYDTVRGTGFAGDRRLSGLEWLGTVPAHWRVAAVSHYFEVELGKMLNQERAHGDHLRPYLRVANVQWGEIDVSELAMMDFPPREQERYRLQAGDLLVNEGGSWPGRAAVWKGEIDEIYYQKALHRIRPRGGDLTWWLYFCLLTAERMNVFKVQGNSSTMTHLTREQLRPQRFPFPDVNEQEQAVKYLRGAEAKARAIRDLLLRQQATLAERRQALITAAVTGKFDVSAASGRRIEE